jgi:uncharacterized protein (DUF927 family)
MLEVGQRARAGQQVRLIDIPADAGAGYGIFENLHGFSSGDVLARHLKDGTSRYYGVPLRVFLERFTERLKIDRDDLIRRVEECRRDFIAKHVPAGASGQVLSVASRFALIAAGGEIATMLGVTGWPDGEAERGAGLCFNAWLSERGSAGDREVDAGIAQVRAFIEAHGNSRFESAWEPKQEDKEGNERETRIINRAGFKRRDEADAWEYLVLVETWRGDICKGHDPRMVAKAMVACGLLIPGNDGKPASAVRVPGYPTMKLYVIASTILGDGA